EPGRLPRPEVVSTVGREYSSLQDQYLAEDAIRRLGLGPPTLHTLNGCTRHGTEPVCHPGAAGRGCTSTAGKSEDTDEIVADTPPELWQPAHPIVVVNIGGRG